MVKFPSLLDTVVLSIYFSFCIIVLCCFYSRHHGGPAATSRSNSLKKRLEHSLLIFGEAFLRVSSSLLLSSCANKCQPVHARELTCLLCFFCTLLFFFCCLPMVLFLMTEDTTFRKNDEDKEPPPPRLVPHACGKMAQVKKGGGFYAMAEN